MELVRLYWRAITLLKPEKGLAIWLTVASVAIAIVQLAEPILFGRVVDAQNTRAIARRCRTGERPECD